MKGSVVKFPGNKRPVENKEMPGTVIIMPVIRIEGRPPGSPRRRRGTRIKKVPA